MATIARSRKQAMNQQDNIMPSNEEEISDQRIHCPRQSVVHGPRWPPCACRGGICRINEQVVRLCCNADAHAFVCMLKVFVCSDWMDIVKRLCAVTGYC